MEELKLVLVRPEECPECEPLRKELKRKDVRDLLKERYGKEEFEEKIFEKDRSAVDLLYSLNYLVAPVLVVHRKGVKEEVCRLSWELEEMECAQVVPIPEK